MQMPVYLTKIGSLAEILFDVLIMPSFSQRKGLKPLQKTIQIDTVDQELRARLWTLLKLYIWDYWRREHRYDPKANQVEILLDKFWFKYFKRPIDNRPEMYGGEYGQGTHCYDVLRSHFFECEWNEVYDFIEFLFSELGSDITDELNVPINAVLTEENSAYRLVSKQFAEITNELEIANLESAIKTKFQGVNAHMTAAISFMSDRKSPDYRNSIKESISAVESLFKVLTNKKSVTLSEGLKSLPKSILIHPALLQGFDKIYAYTSDQGGIRHGIFDTNAATFSDAKFMAVSCSAFITYVIGKCAESGHKI